jgi:hypothetical protein
VSNETSRSGPRRRVNVASRRLEATSWRCALECGHTVTRTVWSRDDGSTHWDRTQPPAPTWVHCEQCKESK